MSAAREEMSQCVADDGWQRLLQLESRHREIQNHYDRTVRRLDEAALSCDRRDLLLAWNQYRSVVADLSSVAREIGSVQPGF